jgi:hypothetical protein
MGDGREIEEWRMLEEAGWEPEERAGGTVWRHPETGIYYDQDKAMSLLREGADAGNVPKEPEGGT